jgi:hypothetical protein
VLGVRVHVNAHDRDHVHANVLVIHVHIHVLPDAILTAYFLVPSAAIVTPCGPFSLPSSVQPVFSALPVAILILSDFFLSFLPPSYLLFVKSA